MKKSNFWNTSLFGFVLKNIFIAAVIILVVVAMTLFSLRFYTKHGERETVPELKDLTIEDAHNVINKHHLKYEIIDSVYVKNKKRGIVIEQNPAPNTVVKPYRTVYLIINSRAVRQIALPDLRDISLRQAEAIAKSMGINVASVEYAPSDYRDLILDVKYNGQSLPSGSKIPEESAIVLVAGNGSEQTVEGAIPYLQGMTLRAASELLASTSYVLGNVNYDVHPVDNSHDYQIIAQNPEGGSTATPGTAINVWLSKNATGIQEEGTRPRLPTQDAKREKEKVKDIEEFF